ncbi:hypothetical protein BT96DRAFT_1017879 [Gymnopus androsaceus JB14]|uniref:F-box domain-containing protein n=1 Tax=Gymnopus androsaceus JB14 TaxID=1447944 RepID=A0A6A4HV39_9AGAR|nr:hypothetical protein BT96DRAFT_1017879 [Gymnopus androsaceus JB14]
MPAEFRKVRGRLGLLERLARDVPLDIMFEIFGYLNNCDLLNLARTSRDLRGVLMSKSSELIWRTARSNMEGLPPPPKGLSEPHYADLLFGKHCYATVSLLSGPFVLDAVRSCAVKTFPHFQTLKRAQPKAYRDENILPRERIAGIYRYVRKSTPARQVGHPAMSECLKQEYEALEDDEQRVVWIQLKKEEAEAVQEHGRLCENWYETMSKNRDNKLTEKRKEAVIRKLEDLGWGEEIKLIFHPSTVQVNFSSSARHSLFSHDLVKQPKELTEQAWRRMRDDLVDILSDHKTRRLATEQEETAHQRYSKLERVYAHFSTADLREPFPPLGDILNHQLLEYLIWETPTEDNLTEGFFSDKLSELLPDFVQQWRLAKALSVLKEVVEECGLDPSTATKNDMDVVNPLVECLVCERTNTYGYGSYGRLFMGWRTSPFHRQTSSHAHHKLAINSFGEETEAILKLEPTAPNIRCAHCHEAIYGTSRDATGLTAHLEEVHKRTIDKQTSLYAQVITADWYWNPRSTAATEFRYVRQVTYNVAEGVILLFGLYIKLSTSTGALFSFLYNCEFRDTVHSRSIAFQKITGPQNASNVTMAQTLLVNAIVGKENVSTVECWAIQPGYQISPQTGTIGDQILQLGNLANASYIVFPSDGNSTDSGLHNAPYRQWVILLSGSGNINFPNASTTPNLTVTAGELFIADDIPGTSSYGHRSVWASGTIAIQMPFLDGVVVGHKVINNRGACK